MARRRNRRNSTGPDSLVGPVGAFFDSLKSGDIIEMAAISVMGMSKRFSGDYHPWKVGRRSHSKKYNVTSLRLDPVTGPKASARAAVKLYKRRDRVSAGVGDMGLILKGLRRAAKSNRRKNSRRNVAAGPAWNRAKARENHRRNASTGAWTRFPKTGARGSRKVTYTKYIGAHPNEIVANIARTGFGEYPYKWYVGNLGTGKLIAKGTTRTLKEARDSADQHLTASPTSNRRRNGSRRRNTGISWGGSGGVIWGKIKGSHDVFTVERPFIGQKWVLKFYEDGRSPGTILASGHDVDALQRRGDKFYALHTGTGTRKTNPHGLSKAEEKKVRSEIQQDLVGAFMRVLKQATVSGPHATPAQLEANKIGWGSRLLDGYKARPDSVGFQAVKRDYFGGHSASAQARSWLNSVNDSRWDTIIRAAAKEAIARHGAGRPGRANTRRRRNASVTWGDSVSILGGVLSGSRGVVTEPVTGGWNVHLTYVHVNARKYGKVGETKRIQAKFLEKAGKRKNRRRNGDDYL